MRRAALRTAVLAGVLLAIHAPLLQAQKGPNIELGFKPDKIYLFNGNLMITIPIGLRYPIGGSLSFQLVMTYNSKVWDYKYDLSETGVTHLNALPNYRSNAGVGWRVSLGRLMNSSDPTVVGSS